MSCKSETEKKTNIENGIDPTVVDMWSDFTDANPEFKNGEMPESWFFHNNRKDANRLAQLTLTGKKQASSGLYLWYEEASIDLPEVGTQHIITNFDGKAQAIIEIRKVDTIPFNQIAYGYAELDMGTTIEPLKRWKNAHWDFFAGAMKESGQQPTEEMLVVCEWFETIWPEYK